MDQELDSLDFLRVLETINQDAGVNLPETAYRDVATVDGLVRYVTTNG